MAVRRAGRSLASVPSMHQWDLGPLALLHNILIELPNREPGLSTSFFLTGSSPLSPASSPALLNSNLWSHYSSSGSYIERCLTRCYNPAQFLVLEMAHALVLSPWGKALDSTKKAHLVLMKGLGSPESWLHILPPLEVEVHWVVASEQQRSCQCIASGYLRRPGLQDQR